MGTHRAHALLAAALAGCCGCSFVAVRGPPSSPVAPDAPLECTRSRTAPALDTTGAIVSPLVGLGVFFLCSITEAMNSWGSDPQRLPCGALLAVGISAGVVYGGSAAYGYHVTGDCRRQLEERWRAATPDPGR